jgi:hypothetical protein
MSAMQLSPVDRATLWFSPVGRAASPRLARAASAPAACGSGRNGGTSYVRAIVCAQAAANRSTRRLRTAQARVAALERRLCMFGDAGDVQGGSRGGDSSEEDGDDTNDGEEDDEEDAGLAVVPALQDFITPTMTPAGQAHPAPLCTWPCTPTTNPDGFIFGTLGRVACDCREVAGLLHCCVADGGLK